MKLHHALSVLIAIVSLSIANFGLAVIESDANLSEVFGATTTVAQVALAVGLAMTTLQVAFVFGGIMLSYINAYEQNWYKK